MTLTHPVAARHRRLSRRRQPGGPPYHTGSLSSGGDRVHSGVGQEGSERSPVIAEGPVTLDLPEVWGHGSFPASDPPANW